MKSLFRESARVLSAAAVTLCVSGCGLINSNSDLAAVYQLITRRYEPHKTVSREEAAAVPYASAGLRIGASDQYMLIMAMRSTDQVLWAMSGVSIETVNGRVIRTAGIPVNFVLTPITRESPDTSQGHTEWQLDYPERQLFGILLACSTRKIGPEDISILGQKIHTELFKEECTASGPSFHWSYANTYWRDSSDGLAWKSIQHVSPDFPPVEIEVLRAPS